MLGRTLSRGAASANKCLPRARLAHRQECSLCHSLASPKWGAYERAPCVSFPIKAPCKTLRSVVAQCPDEFPRFLAPKFLGHSRRPIVRPLARRRADVPAVGAHKILAPFVDEPILIADRAENADSYIVGHCFNSNQSPLQNLGACHRAMPGRVRALARRVTDALRLMNRDSIGQAASKHWSWFVSPMKTNQAVHLETTVLQIQLYRESWNATAHRFHRKRTAK